MCYSLRQGVFHHMKKIRGILVLAIMVAIAAYATTAHAGCYYDPKQNIVWCTDAVDPDDK